MLLIGLEPKAPGLHIFSGMLLPRLGLPLLLTMAQLRGHEAEVYCEDIAPIDWERVQQADLILISSITSTAPRAYEFIRKIRQELGCTVPILMGGSHVTFLPDEALDNGATYVFRHEADVTFMQFLSWYEGERDPKELFGIKNLSFVIGGQKHHTPNASDLVDLNSLPTPDLRLIQGFKNPDVIPIIRSRGCPWDCEFCSEVAMFGSRYRFRSIERVIEDIQYYDRIYGYKIPIFFADDNFGANFFDLERLCQEIVRRDLVRPFSGQVRLDLAKREKALATMSQAGFDRVFIGYESVEQQSLDSAGKKLTAADMHQYTKIIHKYRFSIHAMFVLGFDYDSLETVKRTIRCCIRWGIETVQFLILVPIPGSRLYKRLAADDRIVVKDWAKYDGHHVTFTPRRITAAQLQIAVMLEAMPKAYRLLQTYKLLASNSLRTIGGVLTRKTRHPTLNLKGNLVTFFARLHGRLTLKKIKPQLQEYLREIP